MPFHALALACGGETSFSAVFQAVDESTQVAGLLLPEWVPGGQWARVHRSCQQNFLPSYESVVADSMTRGVACLERLKNSATPAPAGAVQHLNRLAQQLRSRGPISIICNETDNESSWVNGMARASTSHDENVGSLTAPFISINPVYRYSSPGQDPSKTMTQEVMSQTIFHEAIHTLGHPHSNGPEYAYACGDCCFPEAGTPDYSLNAACKVCQTSYSSTLDPAYTQDMVGWGMFSNHPRIRNLAMENIRQSLDAGGDQRLNLVQLIRMGGPNELFNNLMAEELSTRFAPLNNFEQGYVNMVVNFKDYPDNAPILERARTLVSFYRTFHFERNPAGALELLRNLPAGLFPETIPGATSGTARAYRRLRNVAYEEGIALMRFYVEQEDWNTATLVRQNLERVGVIIRNP